MMAAEEISRGVFVEAGGAEVTLAVSPSSAARARPDARGRRTSATSPADPHERLREALREADYQIAAELEVRPPAAVPGRRPRTSARVPQVSVAVGANENAVVLVESESGVFAWRGAEARTGQRQTRGGGRETLLTFRIGAPAAAPPRIGRTRRGPVGDWLGDKLVEPVRAWVLRFAVTRVVDLAVRRIEGDNPTGPVLIAGTDPTKWTPGPLALVLPQDRPARILLMVHGTFSSTAGSFGMLAASKEGRDFLAAITGKGGYDVVLGYDHHTLVDNPRTNAEAILATLTALGPAPGSVIDAVAFSRGGLVYRVLAEQLIGPAGLDATLGKAVFVGCTNGGTNLAEPENWAELVDTYTNIVMAVARAAALVAGAPLPPGVGFAIRTIGRFVQMLSEVAISERRLPGLAAMEPDGALVRALNEVGAGALLDRYHAITSSFEPDGSVKGFTKAVAAFLADRVTDRLFAEPNDLVVHTGSMTDFGAVHALDPARIYAFGDTGLIYHTIYFGDAEVARLLSHWLNVSTAAAAAVPVAISPTLETPASRRRGSIREVRAAGVAIEIGLPTMNSRPGKRMGMSPVTVDLADAEFETLTPAPPPRRRRESSAATEAAPAKPRRTAGAPKRVERHLSAEMNPFPQIGTAAKVWVAMSPDPIPTETHAAAGTATASLDAAQPLVVEIIPRRNCRIVGEATRTLDVGQAAGTGAWLVIEGITIGEAELVVEARQGSGIAASFLLKPIFIAADAKPLGGQQAFAPRPGEAVPVLRIYEFKDGRRLTLRFDLIADDADIAVSAEQVLDGDFDLGAYVAGVLADIENAYGLADVAGNTKDKEQKSEAYQAFLATLSAAATVRAKGLIPEKVRAALWAGRDRIKAIQIISDEPRIPWELMYIADPTGKAREKRGFLSEWGVVRWLHGVPPPPRTLGFKGERSRSVMPDYLDDTLNLEGVTEERAMLAEVLPGIVPIEPTSLAVCKTLDDEAAIDVLHSLATARQSSAPC